MANEIVPSPAPGPMDLSVIDKSNPRSVINLLPPVVAQALEEHMFTHPELFEKDERALALWLRKEARVPSPTDNRLRLKFWDEYGRAQQFGAKEMNMSNVMYGVLAYEIFYNKYIKNPQKMAWLLCQPTAYMTAAEEALEFAMEQVRDVLEIPHTSTIGHVTKVNTSLLNAKIKILEMLHTIVKGAPVQRTMNLNVTAKDGAKTAAMTEAVTSEQLMRKLKELERLNRQAQNLPPPPGESKDDGPDPT